MKSIENQGESWCLRADDDEVDSEGWGSYDWVWLGSLVGCSASPDAL